MLLSARLLDDVQNVNSFQWANRIEFTEGDSPVIYFQLLNKTAFGGPRYVPAFAATLMVTFDNVDSAKSFTRAAVQAFPSSSSVWGDSSIYKVTIIPSDYLRGTVSMRFLLTEGSVVTRGALSRALRVHPQSDI